MTTADTVSGAPEGGAPEGDPPEGGPPEGGPPDGGPFKAPPAPPWAPSLLLVTSLSNTIAAMITAIIIDQRMMRCRVIVRR